MHSVCLQPLAPHSCPCLFLIPLEPHSLSSMLVVFLLSGGSCSTKHNAKHCFGALALLSTFSSQHSPPTLLPSRLLLSSISLCCPLLPPFFPFFPFSLPLPFPLSLVVDWVSECLWQLCVVCNRAERLV